MRKVAVLLFLLVLVLGLSASVFAQATLEGKVTHVDTNKHTLTIHPSDNSSKKTVSYDASTKWEGMDKDHKTTAIEVKDVTAGDHVSCVLSADGKMATQVTKQPKK